MIESYKTFIVERRHIFQTKDNDLECRNLIGTEIALTAEDAAKAMYNDDINRIMRLCCKKMQTKQLELEADNSKLQFSVFQKGTCFISDMYFGYKAHEAEAEAE